MRVWDQFARRHRRGLTAVGVLLFPVVAAIDFGTGSLLHLYILYFIPVGLFAWVRGARAGFLAALVSFVLLLSVEMTEAVGHGALAAGIANAALRGLVLLFVALLVSRAVADRAELENRVQERTEALRLSEARWQAAVEGNADGLWDWHIPTGRVHFSRVWKRMLGHEDDEVGDGLEEFSSRLHPDDRFRAETAIAEYLAGRSPRYESEFRLRCKDGSWKWILDRGSIVERDDDGRPRRAIGTHSDITRRKLVEQELALFKAVIEASNEAVGIADVTGGIVFVNRAHEALFGPRRGNLRDYFPAASVEVFNSRIAPALARGESGEAVLDAIGADGGIFPLWSRTDAIRDANGGLQWIFGVMHDLTDAKRAEAELRASEERYRSVVTAVHEGIVVYAADGRIETANPAAARILGLTVDQLEGRSSFDPRWETVHEDGSPFPGDRHPAMVTLRTGAPESDVIMGVRRPDSGLAWVLINTQPIGCSTKGTPERVVVSFADITSLRSTERSLRALLREKQALLMEVHHRVKNNLQVITSLLRLESGRASEDATRAVLKDMQTRISAMALLHETIYRSESFVALDLSSYLNQLATQFFRAQVRDGSIRLNLDTGGAAQPVAIDQAVTCGLLVSELMTNTIKHAFPAGRGGEVKIGLAAAEDGAVRLTVSDDGVGLPADLAARQANSLGLLLVNDLARQLGGSLQTASEGGASFSVTFHPKPLPATV